jgi:hypothetical protein
MLFRDVVSNIALKRESKNVLGFYIKRIADEQSTRVITAVLALIMVAFQSVTFLAPPQVSEASSGSANDILYGGYSSKTDLLRKFDSNPELRAIYTRVGIGRDEIVRATASRVNSSWDVWSMGRTRHGEQNVQLDIPGAHTAIYLRPLRVWGNNKWFSGLRVKRLPVSSFGYSMIVVTRCLLLIPQERKSGSFNATATSTTSTSATPNYATTTTNHQLRVSEPVSLHRYRE